MDTKVATDALALNLLIKRMFVDSRVKNASIRRLMSLFKVSYDRCVKAVGEGIKRGLLIKTGNDLIASRIHFKKEYSILIETTVHDKDNSISPTLTQMGNLIREAVIYNHIAKQNELADTIRLATNPNGDEYDAHKRARRRMLKKGMRVDSQNANAVLRLSYARICSLISVSRTKAKSIIKSMCKKGLILIQHCFDEAGVSIEKFTRQMQWKTQARMTPGAKVYLTP